jgi:hypothetical protein
MSFAGAALDGLPVVIIRLKQKNMKTIDIKHWGMTLIGFLNEAKKEHRLFVLLMLIWGGITSLLDYRDKPKCTVNGGAKPGYIFTAAGIKLVAFHQVLAADGPAGNGQDGFTL